MKGKNDGRNRILTLLDLEEGAAELLQHPFQVGEIGALVDDQPLDLMEHRRVGLVAVAAIGAARADDADRRLLAQHGSHLHRRGVGAQQPPFAVGLRVEEERVVHLPGRVTDREVQGREVVEVALDVRAFGHRETHIGEDRRDLVRDLADRMKRPLSTGASRTGSDTSSVSDASRAASASVSRVSRRCVSAAETRSLRRFRVAPLALRSSGAMRPSVAIRAETDPFLPSAATRTASSAVSVSAASISARMLRSSSVLVVHEDGPFE